VLKSSPHVKTFTFQYHKNVPGIENIPFTIDTINCIIYNEDSVAYGNNLSKLLPIITYTGNPRDVKINNVSWNTEDSIDFSQPVSMHILSQNQKNEATYTITINQHSVNPDEIVWKEPTTLATNTSSFKVTTTSKALYVFVCEKKENTYQYTTYVNQLGNWLQGNSFESEYEITSIATFQDQIYAIDQTGTLLLQFSQDQWTNVGTWTEGTMTKLLGSLDNTLWIAGKNSNSNAILLFYNGKQLQQNTQSILPNQFNLEGATPLQTPYGLYLIGGIQDGAAQNCIISSDNGYYWTNILNQTDNYSITPCYEPICAYYDHSIFVMNGFNNGEIVEDNYISNNNGYSWDQINSYQQQPSTFSFQKGACAAVYNNNLYLFSKQENNQNVLEVWEGRIRRVDFIRK
jgi:hypothetical protein